MPQSSVVRETDDLVVSGPGHDRIGILFIVLEERSGILRKPEEICLLSHLRERPAAVGACVALSYLRFGNVGLAGDAVPSLVLSLVYVSVGHEPPEYFLDDLLMPFVRSSDKIVVRYVQDAPEPLKVLHDLVAELLRGYALLQRDSLDLLSVFIRPCQEPCLLSPGLVPAGKHIGGDRRIGMSYVGHVVDVVDRCGYVKILLGHLYYLPGTVLENVPFYSVSWDTILY
jgi:hypothetical protein